MVSAARGRQRLLDGGRLAQLMVDKRRASLRRSRQLGLGHGHVRHESEETASGDRGVCCDDKAGNQVAREVTGWARGGRMHPAGP